MIMADPLNPPIEIWSLAWFKEAASLVQACLVSVTAVVTLLGVNAWRQQMIGKRKAELAEQVLISFYEARDVFIWARSWGILGGESESRTSSDDEDEKIKQQRNTYFIPIERLTQQKELFSKLRAQQYAFKAYFGEDTVKPFNILNQAHNTIIGAASTLIEIARYSSVPQTEAIAFFLNELGWGTAKRPDKMDKEASLFACVRSSGEGSSSTWDNLPAGEL